MVAGEEIYISNQNLSLPKSSSIPDSKISSTVAATTIESNSIRHVTFAPTPPKIHSRRGDDTKPRRRSSLYCHSYCRTFCIWSCLTFLCIFFLFALVAALILFHYQPLLPEFYIKWVDVTTFNMTKSSSRQKYLSIQTNSTMESLNRNKNVKFNFSALKVQMLYDEVSIGEIAVPAYTQNAMSRMSFQFETGIYNTLVKDGSRLQESFEKRQLALHVCLKGTLRLMFGKWPFKSPFKVVCKNIDVFEVIEYRHECNVKLLTSKVIDN